MKTKAILVSLGSCALLAATTALAAPATKVAIDTRQTAHPISPYIYGQFIEHLGRCIYGGLWAEMLEDRKFYYAVTGEAPAWEMFRPGRSTYEGEGHEYELLVRSPWLIVGDKSAVTMAQDHPFVGEHTPEIQLPGNRRRAGLIQERLGLEEGRRYEGHIVLSGDASAAPIEVSLVWGSGASDRQTVRIDRLTAEYTTVPLAFTAGRSTDDGRFEIIGRGSGHFRIGTASLMPADNIYGWRPDTVALVKQLDSPVYRWPGGNFVSGYNWHDGIGDRDHRPPRKNPAWKGVEPNDVGMDEFMKLCRLLNTEPYVAVNTGLGGAEEAAAEVEYANGSVDTPMGKLRAQNGSPEPYHIKFWAVGNEMFGDWQLGHMPLSKYVQKNNEVVNAMRAVDPNIQLVAVGNVGEWSREMLKNCADHMDLISEHLYWQNKRDLIAHVEQVPAGIRRVAEAHRAYGRELESLRNQNVPIAMDEWNYWYGPNEYGELGVRYFLQDALGIAAGLHEYFRNSDLIFMANYAQTVNVIGAIKTTKTDAEMAATGLVLKLYRHHFGQVPVKVSGDYQPLDVSAALTDDKRALTVAVVNPTPDARALSLDLSGATLNGTGRQWVLTGPDRWAYNAPGEPRQVDIIPTAIEDASRLEIEPLSVTLWNLWIK